MRKRRREREGLEGFTKFSLVRGKLILSLLQIMDFVCGQFYVLFISIELS